MLPSLQAMEGCVWLQTHATDCWIELFEPSRGADKRAARAKRRDKMRDATGRLLPNLVGGCSVVRLPIRGIAVLVRVEIFFRIFLNNLVRPANCAVGAFITGCDHQLRAE